MRIMAEKLGGGPLYVIVDEKGWFHGECFFKQLDEIRALLTEGG